MSNILRDLSEPALSESIEANFAEEMACFGRGLPGAELHEDEDLLWFFTGRPHLNGVLLTHFTRDDEASINAKIDATLAYFQARHVDVGWSVGPSTRPTNFAAYLEAHGFTYAIDTIGLALDIHSMHKNLHTSTELVIQEAVDRETLLPLHDIQVRAFGAAEEASQIYLDTYLNIGFGPSKPWHHYIGYLHGEAVAISSLLLHAGIAGLYGIATIPKVRRQGVGAAITLHTLREARALGYRIAALSPTKMSEGLYQRIGFREYCRISHYGWSAES